MNIIPIHKKNLAESLFLSGLGSFNVAREVGINKLTAATIRKKLIASDPSIHCPCGKALGHSEWCGHRVALSPLRTNYLARVWKDISQVNIYIPSRPRYERPDIPGERETEIPLLVNRRFINSIDAPLFDGDCTLHDRVAMDGNDPLSLLILKEEAGEDRLRLRRAEEFCDWKRGLKKTKPMFYFRGVLSQFEEIAPR